MIFVTVGTQIPFDRLIKAVDVLAPELGGEPVVAQTSGRGRYVPQHIRTVGFLSPAEFDEYMDRARIVIAHAGMGTVISAVERHKPLIVMPRLARFGEHRNDHQRATAEQLLRLGVCSVAGNIDDLRRFVMSPQMPAELSTRPAKALIDSLIDIIDR